VQLLDVQQARDYFEGYAPSSPSFALIKDGKITEMIERHQIVTNRSGNLS
jgi:putative YphP/YqiW family bacilliredoxin